LALEVLEALIHQLLRQITVKILFLAPLHQLVVVEVELLTLLVLMVVLAAVVALQMQLLAQKPVEQEHQVKEMPEGKEKDLVPLPIMVAVVVVQVQLVAQQHPPPEVMVEMVFKHL
jgi:hypothetical protein